MDKINVYHIVSNKFFRVHFPFKDTDKIRNIFVVASGDKPAKYKNIKTGYNLLKNEDVYFTDVANIFDLFKFLSGLYKKFKPHVTICSKFEKVDIRDHIKNNGSKLFYINHGLLTDNGGNKRTVVWSNDYAQKYDRYFFTKFEIPYMLKAKMPPESLIQIGGSPQLDYLFQIDLDEQRKNFTSYVSKSTGKLTPNCTDPIDPNKKFVLLIENNGGIEEAFPLTGMEMTHEDYRQILAELIKQSEIHDFHIISKIKSGIKTDALRALHEHKNVILIEGSKEGFLLYHLMFANIIFVQNSSTAYSESMLINPNVISAHMMFHNDNLKIKERGLLRTDSAKDIANVFTKFLNNTLVTPEYLKNREKYIFDTYGEIDKNVMQKIYDEVHKVTGIPK